MIFLYITFGLLIGILAKRKYFFSQNKKNLNADIRNKLSPILNLCTMLEDSETELHQNKEMSKLIRQEIVVVKKNIDYLKNVK